MNKRQGKFNQSENTKRSKFREAFDKQRLRKNTEAYNNLQNKRNGKREGIKNMYDTTNARAEEFLKNKPNSANDKKSKGETMNKVDPMMKNKSKTADTIKPSINKKRLMKIIRIIQVHHQYFLKMQRNQKFYMVKICLKG